MASDDAPVLVGSVLLGGLGVARLSVSVAAFFFRAWLAVMRVVWRQAHFAVGAALVVVAGTGLALLFDWNVALTVTALAVTNGWLFLPTSDLVWMARRGYVSPACVRLALSAVAAAMGADEVTEKRELRREARLVAKLERYRDWQTEEEARRRNPNAGRTRGGAWTPRRRRARPTKRARRTPTTTMRHRPDPTTTTTATTRPRGGAALEGARRSSAPRVRDGS